MSFPKGPRFEPQQISDVPGPNSYNLCQESALDAYKRGAFFEKADRFSKDLPSEVPGPGTYNNTLAKTEAKSTTRPPTNLGDRYAALQRKVEDLERMHNEGKKAHQTEVERLKLELSRCQKTNAEHADRFEKQKKQNAALDARIQDLKKASSEEQVELKDLRVKLRMSEHERTQLSLRQGEAGELKKAIQSLESKRREEVRERDRKREIAESRLQELHGKGNLDLDAAHAESESLKVQLADAQEKARQAIHSLRFVETDTAEKQATFLDQLEQHRVLISRVAAEYGRLASASVPTTVHSALKHQHGVLLIRASRLERKLANSEGQVTELVNLIHHAHDRNTLLIRQVQDLREECDFYCQMLFNKPNVVDLELGPLYDDLDIIMHDIRETKQSIGQSDTVLGTLWSQFYRLTCDELMLAHLTATMELDGARTISRDRQVELSKAQLARESLEAELAKMHDERDQHTAQLAIVTAVLDNLKVSAATTELQKLELEQRMETVIKESEVAIAKDKNALQRLTESVQRSRMTEEGLRSEVDLLTAELAHSEQFQSAYYSLSDEVKSLIARNELAEGEAQQLSKFNAEILGHHNPAQRIMYVDRIRRELAETKHRLAVNMMDCESLTSQNAELIRELEMYKSATIPVENKPRTVVTRISRPPLSVLNQNDSRHRHLDDMILEDFTETV
ncbi:hypothetical protein B0H10DRAFT_2062676 [Mycena sp. CBHHK59/15]|nr:hypothetical protein B0H10DRAFT_2062676 [Mycena sp. CBHHK59/15]